MDWGYECSENSHIFVVSFEAICWETNFMYKVFFTCRFIWEIGKRFVLVGHLSELLATSQSWLRRKNCNGENTHIGLACRQTHGAFSYEQLMWEDPAYCRWCTPWTGGLGRCKKAGRESYEEEAHMQRSLGILLQLLPLNSCLEFLFWFSLETECDLRVVRWSGSFSAHVLLAVVL